MKSVVTRSDPNRTFCAKIWGPVLCAVSWLFFSIEDFPDRRSLVTLPVLVAALFGASLAIVEVRGGVLRYRRLFRWKTIPKDDIVSARIVWGPFIGSMRLKRFVFPWGRLYFVLDANSDPNQADHLGSGLYFTHCLII
jgi:hypothetical protein